MADYVIHSLASHLINDAGVTAELTASDDVYIDVAPPNHGTRYITITQLSEPQVQHFGGPSGLATTQLQVSCWAETTPLDAAKTANAVRLAVDGIRNDTLGTAPNNKVVQSVWVEDSGRAHFVESDVRGAGGIYGWLLAVGVGHAVTTPA